VRGIEEADARAIVAALDGALRWDLEALLAGAGVPALVLAAPDARGSFPRDPGSALRGGDREAVRAALAPDRFVVIDGGHCLHRDDPAGWVAAVDGFARAALG
jgi:pimeloyl-ACP methyl ester carboxylesterase